jgi:hypothetical protein
MIEYYNSDEYFKNLFESKKGNEGKGLYYDNFY